MICYFPGGLSLRISSCPARWITWAATNSGGWSFFFCCFSHFFGLKQRYKQFLYCIILLFKMNLMKKPKIWRWYSQTAQAFQLLRRLNVLDFWVMKSILGPLNIIPHLRDGSWDSQTHKNRWEGPIPPKRPISWFFTDIYSKLEFWSHFFGGFNLNQKKHQKTNTPGGFHSWRPPSWFFVQDSLVALSQNLAEITQELQSLELLAARQFGGKGIRVCRWPLNGWISGGDFVLVVQKIAILWFLFQEVFGKDDFLGWSFEAMFDCWSGVPWWQVKREVVWNAGNTKCPETLLNYVNLQHTRDWNGSRQLSQLLRRVQCFLDISILCSFWEHP